MAWNTQETQRRLMEAARTEFAAKGLDGATMACIATRAGINRERLYNYFGDKHALFESVLTREPDQLAAWLASRAPVLEQVGEFTGCIFDYHADHPELARLLLWEGLAGGPAVQEAPRTAHCQRVVAHMTLAQHNKVLNTEIEPAKLLFLLIALVAWWFSVPQLARMITGSDGLDASERANRRLCVVTAARQLAAFREPQS